jgi:hypothetical protein
VESVEDVLAEFEFLIPRGEMPVPIAPKGNLGEVEKKVLEGL